jgi:cysteinyl-tRNA synthetase
MHNAWVTASGEKMSKSLGNSLQVQELLKRVRGIELRWYLGSAHYRSMLEFSFEALEESAVNFRRIEGFLTRSKELLGYEADPVISPAFADAMNDDLAVPTALAHVSEALRAGNTAITAGDQAAIATAASEIRGALSVLGCDPLDPAFAATTSADVDLLDNLIKLALEQRTAARARKDFASSDAIRDQLANMGVVIEDTAHGPRWSIN